LNKIKSLHLNNYDKEIFDIENDDNIDVEDQITDD
jgi:hypothetical protein